MSDQVVEPHEGELPRGTWVILELFGHKVVAGYMSRDESLGAPLIRLDVPETKTYPAFTRHYNPSAIYSVSYVSEETARLTAESVSENPVSVYVPELSDLRRLNEENEKMRTVIERLQRSLQNAQLPEGERLHF